MAVPAHIQIRLKAEAHGRFPQAVRRFTQLAQQPVYVCYINIVLVLYVIICLKYFVNFEDIKYSPLKI